jgi:hypothetical protein
LAQILPGGGDYVVIERFNSNIHIEKQVSADWENCFFFGASGGLPSGSLRLSTRRRESMPFTEYAGMPCRSSCIYSFIKIKFI